MAEGGTGARLVIGAPLFNKADYVAESLGSLLAQDVDGLRLVLIDDGSTDGTAEIARALAERDPRVSFHANPTRLGMLENTRRAFTLARELFPDAEYWALGSDHDLWHPGWARALLAELDARPELALAYPQSQRIDEHGTVIPRRGGPKRFETRAVGSPRERFARTARWVSAGDMIYGIFRAAVLDRTGFYRPLLVPDRLLLSEVALHGELGQVERTLWSRRFRGLADLERQKAVFFLDGSPRYLALPWWLTHAGALLWVYGVRGRPGVGRGQGALLAAEYVRQILALRWRRRHSRALRLLLARGRQARRAYRRGAERATLAASAHLWPRAEGALRRPRGRRLTERAYAAVLRTSREEARAAVGRRIERARR